MARYKIVEDGGIYFTTHTIVEWMPVFKEKKYFEIIIYSSARNYILGDDSVIKVELLEML